MDNKTKEQLIREMKEWRKNAPQLAPEDARRLYNKWRESDRSLTADSITTGDKLILD